MWFNLKACSCIFYTFTYIWFKWSRARAYWLKPTESNSDDKYWKWNRDLLQFNESQMMILNFLEMLIETCSIFRVLLFSIGLRLLCRLQQPHFGSIHSILFYSLFSFVFVAFFFLFDFSSTFIHHIGNEQTKWKTNKISSLVACDIHSVEFNSLSLVLI